jgi:hypothetical protein
VIVGLKLSVNEGAREPMRRLVLAAPTRYKVCTDTIVQWIRLYESGVIASVFCVSHPIESEMNNRQFFW